jgi:hypothetical protein
MDPNSLAGLILPGGSSEDGIGSGSEPVGGGTGISETGVSLVSPSLDPELRLQLLENFDVVRRVFEVACPTTTGPIDSARVDLPPLNVLRKDETA